MEQQKPKGFYLRKLFKFLTVILIAITIKKL